MNSHFSSLERKIDAVLALCEQLRRENLALKENNQSLSLTIDTTRVRLEALMDKLPAE